MAEEKEEVVQEEKKDNDVYFPVGARAVVYPYEMVDNAAGYLLIAAVLLSLICLTVGVSKLPTLAKVITYVSSVVLEVLILIFFIYFHRKWYYSLRTSDEFTLLYDTTTGDIVCYLHTAKEKRIPAKSIHQVSYAPNLLFRPFSRLFKLLDHDIGNLTLQYTDEKGKKRKLVVRDFSRPTLAASRLESLLKKIHAGEEPDLK
ncbi:MAG: hypothetical protein J5736_05600 [Bacilli bacterium]|nr:hypothetical protein [Bacilli bacterium]